jgi:hypothetical protein
MPTMTTCDGCPFSLPLSSAVLVTIRRSGRRTYRLVFCPICANKKGL